MAFRGRVPPKRGTFLRLQVCGKVGITGVEVYTMVGKSVLLVCRVILGTDRLLRPRGGGGFQKSVVYKNCTPLKYFHMKIVPPLGDKNF